MDDVYLIRAQGLPWSCTVEDVLNFFSGMSYVCFKEAVLLEAAVRVRNSPVLADNDPSLPCADAICRTCRFKTEYNRSQ